MSKWTGNDGTGCRRAIFALLIGVLSQGVGADPTVSFGTVTTLTDQAGPGPARSVSADIDGDGDMDLVVTSITNENFRVSVLANDGSGAYSLSWSMGNTNNTATDSVGRPWGVDLADFNGDGDLDLLVGYYDINASSIITDSYFAVFIGDGSGGFGVLEDVIKVSLPTIGYEFVSVAAADFNNDGVPDVAASSGNSTDDVAVYTTSIGSGGALTFSLLTTIAASGTTGNYGLVAADFNNDTWADIATTRGVYVNQQDGSFSLAYGLPGVEAIDTGDFDNDGLIDIAVIGATSGTANTVYVYRNSGGSFNKVLEQYSPSWNLHDVVISDVNGDGYGDILVPDRANDRIRIFTGGCGPRFFAPQAVVTGDEPQTLEVIDVDNDGRADLVSADRASGQDSTLSIVLQNAATASAGEFQLCQTAATVAEDGVIVSFDIVRYNGSAGGASVNVSTGPAVGGILATAGSDYVALSDVPVIFADGESGPIPVTITINDDVLPEDDEEVFGLSLGATSGGATVGSVSSATVTILDNDNALPTVSITGPATAQSGSSVLLDSTASDSDGSIVGYSWVEDGSSLVLTGPSAVADLAFTAPAVDTETPISFTVTVTDNEGGIATASHSMSITPIPDVPVNQLPVAIINVSPGLTVDAGTLVTLDGSASYDPDGTVSSYFWFPPTGISLSSTSTAVTEFTAPAVTAPQTYTISLGVRDNDDAGSVLATVTITVNPGNQAPTADAGPDQLVNEGASVNLDATASNDLDGDTLVYSWSQIGTPAVSLSGAGTATPSFTAPEVSAAAGSEILSFELTVSDGKGGVDTDLVQVTVNHVNQAPTANAGADQSVAEGATVNMDGSASSDPDGDVLSYVWTQVGTPSVTLTGATTASPSFTAPAVDAVTGSITLTFNLVVSDGSFDSAVDPVQITVNHVDLPPTANAGADISVDEGSAVLIAGSGSDVEDELMLVPLSYSWTQTAGPSAAPLNGASTSTLGFTAPAVASGSVVLTFEMTVTDSAAQSSTDSVNVTVNHVNVAPVAVAGPDQSVNEQTPVTLDGSASSDSDGSIVAWVWSQVGGPSVSLGAGATAAEAVFTTPVVTAETTLTFRLTVTDNNSAIHFDDMLVQVLPVNAQPQSNAGADQVVDEQTAVTLNGGGSDSDGSIVAWTWLQTGGTPVVLASVTTATTSFTAPTLTASENLFFTLTVEDNEGGVASDEVMVTVNPVNASPTANAGADQDVDEQTPVSLNGSASGDSDGSIVAYQWSQQSGIGVTLNGADTATADFTAPVVTSVTELVFQLQVTDNEGAAATDTVLVNVLPVNIAPLADAGLPQSVDEGTAVSLSGSASDTDGSIASLLWEHVAQAGDPVISLSGATTLNAAFTAPAVSVQRDFTFSLTATDNEGASHTDTVVITVQPVPNEIPIANAGPDQSVDENTAVTLNGSGSDGDGSISSWQWLQTGGPDVGALTGADTAVLAFTAPTVKVVTILSFELTVTDNEGATGSDTVQVTVNPVNADPNVSVTALVSVNEQSPVNVTATASDSDGSIAGWQWQQLSGPAVDMGVTDSASLSFLAPLVAADTDLGFRITVTDDEGATASADMTVRVLAIANVAPTANAGADLTVNEQTLVTLNGSGSDSDGSIQSWAWSQVSGTTVDLGAANTAAVSFTAPTLTATEILVFQLSVTDNEGASGTDQVSVSVEPVNAAPVASAGSSRTVNEQTLVTLSGAGSSDSDGSITGWQWTQLSGEAVTLASTSTMDTSFQAPVTKDQLVLGFRLTVNDNEGATASADVTITVEPMNILPTVNAGADQVVDEGQTVSLAGSGSDADGSIVSWVWSQVALPGDPLIGGFSAGATPAQASFVAPPVSATTQLTVQLTVTDDEGGEASDTLLVTVQPVVNQIPLANAGTDQAVDEQTPVSLDGNASSDADGSIVTWSWSQLSGEPVTLSGADSAVAGFTAPTTIQALELEFQLTVTDNDGGQGSDTVIVTVNPVNLPPTSSVNPLADVDEGSLVTLSGNCSDTDSGIDTCLWSQLSGGPLVSLTDNGSGTATFTAPDVTADTALNFRLTATDSEGAVSTADVSVTVRVVTDPPQPGDIFISFGSAEYFVDEHGVRLNVEVLRSGDLSGSSSVTLTPAPGPVKGATAGADYVLASSIGLNFAAAESSQIVSIDIIDDSLYEGTESIVLNLGNVSTDAVLGDVPVAEVFIIDNDTPGNAPGWRFPFPDQAATGADRSNYHRALAKLRKLARVTHAAEAVALRSGDVDGDGELELIVLLPNQVVVYDQRLDRSASSLSWTLGNEGDVLNNATGIILEDLDGDGAQEILVGVTTATGAHIDIRHGDGSKLAVIVSARTGAEAHVMNPVAYLGDGRLAVAFRCLDGGNQRGYGVYDIATGAELWFYAFGPAGGAVSVADANGDGVTDFLASHRTRGDGHVGHGRIGTDTATADDQLYHILVSEFGSQLLVRTVDTTVANNKGMVRQVLVDLDNDGVMEILALLTHDAANPGLDKLTVTDPITGDVLHTIDLDGHSAGSMMVADVDGLDGKEIVVLNGENGALSVYGANLVQQYASDSGVSHGDRLHLIADLDVDGIQDLVSSGGNRLLVTDGQSLVIREELVFSHPVGQVIASDLDGDGVAELLVSLGNGDVVLVGPNRAPIPEAADQLISGPVLNLRILPGDPDAEDEGRHQFTITRPPAKGVAEINAQGELIYTAGNGSRGKEALIVTVADSDGAEGIIVIVMNLSAGTVNSVTFSDQPADANIDDGGAGGGGRGGGAMMPWSLLLVLIVWLAGPGRGAGRRNRV